MFNQSVDQRLTHWLNLREKLEQSNSPFVEVWEYWQPAPFIPYNNKIDPYYQASWPTPWEIIVDNKYDDFTKSLMIGWSLKLTERFKNSKIEIRTLVDNSKNSIYNVVIVDDRIAINYDDNGPTDASIIPDYFSIENLVELKSIR